MGASRGSRQYESASVPATTGKPKVVRSSRRAGVSLGALFALLATMLAWVPATAPAGAQVAPPLSVQVSSATVSMTAASGTSTNATVSCPGGTTLVGGGIQQFRSADAGGLGGTGWETQGLKTNG